MKDPKAKAMEDVDNSNDESDDMDTIGDDPSDAVSKRKKKMF